MKKLGLLLASFIVACVPLMNFKSVSAAATNLMPNSSFETAEAADSSRPQSWYKSQIGTNDAQFNFLNSGRTGTRSVEVVVSNFQSGDVKWYSEHVAVTAGQTYKYSDYYKSSTVSAFVAEFRNSAGGYSYKWYGDFLPSATWAQATATFAIPAGVTSMTMLHLINSNGNLVIDDVSLTTQTPTSFSRPLITITFDDGYKSVYNRALPVMQQYGFAGTHYMITGTLNKQSDTMTTAMMLDLQAKGHEIGSHTVTHPSLPTITDTQLQTELMGSRDILQQMISRPVTNIAAPYGDYDNRVLAAMSQYYRSHRTIENGLNTPDNFNIYRIKSYMVEVTTPRATVLKWINEAKATNSWLVLTYHETKPNDNWTYNRKTADFTADMLNIKRSGVKVLTLDQALNELVPQL